MFLSVFSVMDLFELEMLVMRMMCMGMENFDILL